MKRVSLILLFLCLTTGGQAQRYFNFVSTISQHEYPSRVFIGGKASTTAGGSGQGLRRGILFYTGEPDHYGLKYDITSARARYSSRWNNGDIWGTSAGSGKWVQMWIHKNTTRDLPGERIIKFSSHSSDLGSLASDVSIGGNAYKVLHHGRSNSSPNTELEANQHYWIVFDTDYSRSQSVSPSLKIAISNNRGSSPSPARWSVVRGLEAKGWDDGERNSFDHTPGWWSSQDSDRFPLQFAVRGRRIVPDPLEIGDTIRVGNLDEPNFNTGQNLVGNRRETISAQRWVATSFYTSSSPGLEPHVFSVNHITMLNPIRSEVPSNTHFIRIHPNKTNSNGWNHPDRNVTILGEFSPSRPNLIQGDFPGRLSWADEPEQHRFHMRSNHPVFLKPNTIYWLIQGMVHTYSGSSPNLICFTQSTGQKGWPIGDNLRFSDNRGSVWHNRIYSEKLLDRTMRFELDVTVLPAKGDLNLDAKINILDLVAMNNEIAGLFGLPTRTLGLANINDLGGVNSTDRNLLIDLILER